MFFFFDSDLKLCMYILCSPLRPWTKLFYVKLFKISWSLILWLILIIFGMMIDIGPQFYSAPPHPWSGPTDQAHRLGNFMLKFYVKVFKISWSLNLWLILIIFGMMIDIGPQFYSAPPYPWSGSTDQVHKL